MDRELAERLVATLNECIRGLLETLPLVERQASGDEYKAYQRAVAKVINTIDVEVTDRVTRGYPDLKPEARV